MISRTFSRKGLGRCSLWVERDDLSPLYGNKIAGSNTYWAM